MNTSISRSEKSVAQPEEGSTLHVLALLSKAAEESSNWSNAVRSDAVMHYSVHRLLQIEALYCNECNLVHLLHSFLSSSSSTFAFLLDVIILMPIMQVLNEAVGALMWHTIQLTKEVTILILAFTDNLFGQYLFDASDLKTLLRTWRNSKLCELLCESAVESTTLMSK